MQFASKILLVIAGLSFFLFLGLAIFSAVKALLPGDRMQRIRRAGLYFLLCLGAPLSATAINGGVASWYGFSSANEMIDAGDFNVDDPAI